VTKSKNLHRSERDHGLRAQEASGGVAEPRTEVRARAATDEVRDAYAALVREAAGGDRDAMERLLVRAQETAYRVSLLVCGHAEDAEDVMQDALLKTYQHVSRIDDPTAFRTWLYRTVRNACLMKRRRKVDEPAQHVSIEQGAGIEPQPVEVEDRSRAADQQLMDSWVGERLRRALGQLPPTHRAIVVLREIEGLSTRDVASVTGISEANVKTRLHRARAMLRKELGDV
jgi:RNA polymerase sigma-70 factor (ECF subfamily)